MQGPVPPKILVPRSWYQKNGELEMRSLSNIERGGRRGLQAPRQRVWGAGSPPGTAGGLGGGSTPVNTFDGEKVKPIHPLSDKVFERPG